MAPEALDALEELAVALQAVYSAAVALALMVAPVPVAVAQGLEPADFPLAAFVPAAVRGVTAVPVIAAAVRVPESAV